VAQLGGPEPEPGDEMRLAGPERTKQNNVERLADECAGGQMRHGVALETRLIVDAEILE
jgi:hypothetical protein